MRNQKLMNNAFASDTWQDRDSQFYLYNNIVFILPWLKR